MNELHRDPRLNGAPTIVRPKLCCDLCKEWAIPFAASDQKVLGDLCQEFRVGDRNFAQPSLDICHAAPHAGDRDELLEDRAVQNAAPVRECGW